MITEINLRNNFLYVFIKTMSALYLFVILLLVTTVISSFGGALRVEENFYNEVFDLTDENDPLVKSGLEESSDVKPQEKKTEIESDQEKTDAKEEPEGNDGDAITLATFQPENATEEKTEDIVEEELIEEEVEAYEMDDQYATF